MRNILRDFYSIRPRPRCRMKMWTLWSFRSHFCTIIFVILSSFQKTNALDEVVCAGFHMRNTPEFMVSQYADGYGIERWRNCTVIEGDAKYTFMHEYSDDPALTADDFKSLVMPNVREITGSLVIFQVTGLDSVATVLPNLRIIRGHTLFQNYAFIIYQSDLKEIGLGKLSEISNGGVRISTNTELCFASTLSWTDIVKDKSAHIVVEGNQDPNNCGDQCKQSSSACSSRRSTNGVELQNCWNYENCQMVCPSSCTAQNRSCNFDNDRPTCCHEECASGCTGPTDRDCQACRHVVFEGQCMKSCPEGLFMYKNRRCLTAQVCRARPPPTVPSDIEEEKYYKPRADGLCEVKCPKDYYVDPTDYHHCVPCTDSRDCVKKCTGGVITSLSEAKPFEGCTVVNGSLEIMIRSDMTTNLAQKLEESLGEIREIYGYLKVSFSPSLVSLSMFKNLRVIRGLTKRDETANKYAFQVFENQNLAQLWNFSEGLFINGSIQFHYNPLLCYSKIQELATAIGREIDKGDVSEFTNGNKAVCDVVELGLRIGNVEYDHVILHWDQLPTHLIMDSRMLLGYQVYYKKVDSESENVDIFEGRDACHDSWQMEFEQTDLFTVVNGLLPNTWYAFYVTTLTVNSPGAKGGMSKVVFAKTNFFAPSQPRVTKAESTDPNSITMEWLPPLEPNGELAYYKISYTKRKDTLPNERDYCRHKPTFVNEMDNQNGHLSGTSDQPNSATQCDAPIGSSSIKRMLPDVRQQLEKAAFENAVHNDIFPPLVDPKRLPRKKRSIDDQRTGDSIHAQNRTIIDHDLDTISRIPQSTILIDALNITLTNLYHFTSYEIKILACQNESLQGATCTATEVSKIIRTQPIVWKDNVNGSSIRLANATASGSQSVSIQWDQPEDPNGLVLGYEVQYSKVGSSGVDATNQCIPISAYLKQNGYTFTDLAFGQYKVRIRCMSLAQWGEWSEYYYFDIVEPPKFPSIFIILIAVGCSVFVITSVAVFAMYIYKRNFRKKLPEYLMNVFSANPEYISQLEVYKPDEWELKREDIELRHEIGRGTFGTVFAGMGKNTTSVCGVTFGECAVKTVSERASIYDRWHFLIEASVMKQFNVAHIVKLCGVVSEGQPALVVMEMMHRGNLRDYLRSRRPNAEENTDNLSPPTLKETLQWAGEIADGMAYLEAMKFCHRDLAARNCMVSAEGICKIGDFGMARDVYVKDYYRPTGKRLMPVRWMAPEALKDATFTSKSDVWSYGVVLWEIATLASQPYAGLSNEDVMRYVVDHRRFMEMPTGCPQRLYDFMCLCWKYDRKDRPTFADLVALLLPDLNERFRQESYYCNQRLLKEFTSRSSANAKNRHSSQDDQQSSSEAALIASDVESTDDKCFASSLNECSSAEAPFCHSNRISPSKEKSSRRSSSNTRECPTIQDTLLDSELEQIDLEVLKPRAEKTHTDRLLNGHVSIST